MATSGWQNEQWIHTIQAEIYFNGNVRIDGITHSGNSLRVWGTIAFCARGTSGWSGYFNAGVYAAVSGQGDGQILGNGQRLYVGSDVYRSFDVTYSVPAAATSYNLNVRYHSEYFDRTLTWGLSFDSGGTAPSGLSTTLDGIGPDFAIITVNLGSYGSPATSASRYIEGAVLGSSSYGAPYKYKTAQATLSNTFTIDNSGSGGLTITPNTQYHYGGYASNTVLSTSTVTGTFTTLPARPTVVAIDQGHGQIDFTVSHATEGSADTVAEEYSTDDGATWTTITGGTFTLTLSSQTVVTVRRGNMTGYSSVAVTVAPTFNTAIYASVLNKSKLITKVYAPFQTTDRGISGIESVSGNEYANIPEGNYDILMMAMSGNNDIKDKVALQATYQYMDISLWKTPLGQYSMFWHLRENAPTGSSPQESLTLAQTTSFSDFCNMAAQYGVNILPSFESVAPVLTEFYLDISATFENRIVSKKIGKIYASVGGKTTLTFEDPS